MPTIIQSLEGLDLGYLRIVARLWGIELTATDKATVLIDLAAALLEPILVSEIVDSLPAGARNALDTIIKSGGRISWAAFTRQFGAIREAGPGKRDRENIFLQPISVVEVLYYRALVARAFFDMPGGAQEFAYIPDNLIPLISLEDLNFQRTTARENLEKPGSGLLPIYRRDDLNRNEPPGRRASPKDREHPFPLSNRLLDDATSILAALRMDCPLPNTIIPASVILEFLSAASIIRSSPDGKWAEGGEPQIEQVRLFLDSHRKDAMEMLTKSWLESKTFNELHQIPGLKFEGDWNNHPLETRKFLVSLVESIPKNTWWSLPAFILAIKEKSPDFQRPAGDYDSWFIKREKDDLYLRGFDTWDLVDGALIYYLITGPLYWLGLVELATQRGNNKANAFRSTDRNQESIKHENLRLHVSSQGKIVIPRFSPRATRYQIARFCEWGDEKEFEYHYYVTVGSLKKANEQGLKVDQLLHLLVKNVLTEIPPAFIKALKGWEANGTEARLETHTVLRVNKPEVLEELRRSKAGRFLGERLGPVAVIVNEGAQGKIQVSLAELGLLVENVTSSLNNYRMKGKNEMNNKKE
jgi:hypothetical protein